MDRFIYEENRRRLSHAAKVLALISMVLTIVMPYFMFLTAGLAFLAILLAVLSKGHYDKFDNQAKRAVTMSVITIMIGAGVVTYSVNKIVNTPAALDIFKYTFESIKTGEYDEDVLSEKLTEYMEAIYADIQ